MDSLVCDLTNALNSNAVLIKNRKNFKLNQTKKLQNSSKSTKISTKNKLERKVRRHNSLNSFHSSSSSSMNPKKITSRRSSTNLNKHKKIMNLLLAARATIQSNDQNIKRFDSDIHNLVRFKSASSLNSRRSSQCRERPKRKSIKKSKRLRDTKIYKIQKIYRFHSNYRLHCLKLRRLQKKMLKQTTKLPIEINQEKMSVENSSSRTSCSSTITSSYSSYQTTTDLESSSSLEDCYDDLDNLKIDSESDCQLKFKTKCQSSSNKTKQKVAKRKLLTYRQRRQFSNNYTSQSSLNLNSVNQKKMLTFKRKRINCGFGNSKISNFRRFLNKGNDFETIKTEYEDSNNDLESDLDIEIRKNHEKNYDILNQSFISLKKFPYKRPEQEADDEESSESSFIINNNNNNQDFECIPWWNNNENDFINSSSSSTTIQASTSFLSNYKKLNLSIDQNEQNEFNEILNGALDLMNQSSIDRYKNKISFLNKNQKTKGRRKRYNFPSYENSSCASVNKLGIGEPGVPIPDTNIGSKMLKNMGWKPGTSLGNQNNPNSLKEPIIALKRPKRVGLGFGTGEK